LEHPRARGRMREKERERGRRCTWEIEKVVGVWKFKGRGRWTGILGSLTQCKEGG